MNMKKGFTLVEIMIVVAIIAILAAIAIPNFIAYRRTAQMNACIANLKQLDTASEAWLIKTGGTEITTVTMAALVGDTAGMGFIKETLTCPAKGTYTAPTATTGDASHWTCSYATDTEYPHKVPTSTKAEEKKEGGEG